MRLKYFTHTATAIGRYSGFASLGIIYLAVTHDIALLCLKLNPKGTPDMNTFAATEHEGHNIDDNVNKAIIDTNIHNGT